MDAPKPPLPPGPTVAVVDDDPRVRELLRLELADLGATVITCATAAEALALLRRHPVALVLLDLEMPAMDGRSCQLELERHGFQGQVVLMSAGLAPPPAAGTGPFIAKPQLLSRLPELLQAAAARPAA